MGLEFPQLRNFNLSKINLAGVAQWIEHWPANQKVTGSIPGQDTYLDGGPGPWLGECKRQPHINVSLPLFSPSLPLSLKINK